MSKQVLKLYPNVIPVKGFNRSLLMDLQKGKPYLVPNDLIDYLEQNQETLFEEYEQFILDNELGFSVENEFANCLTPLPLNYYPASKINNAILELNEHSSWNLASVLSSLDKLGTQFLEVRFLDYPSLLIHFSALQEYTNNTTIEFIQILVPFNPELKLFLEQTLNERFLRLSKIVVYKAPSGFELKQDVYDLVFTSQESVSHEYCGSISADYFTINTQAYTRNQHFNSCLTHKISVDKNGFICNCPSSNKKYNHVDSVTLSEIISLNEFQELWKITKDKVLICSDCEFRWMCSDCRVFIQDQSNPLSKPSKCGYNPFISLWKDEENYLSEEECGVTYSNGQLTIDKELLETINQRIWG